MIIAFTGYAQVGKDTASDILVRDFGFTKIAFADPIRQMLFALNPLVFDNVRVNDAIEAHGYNQAKIMFPEIRTLLQRMGSEAGRRILGEDIWINTAMNRARSVDKC